MPVQIEYQFLESRPRSNYRQLWVKSRHMRAEVLYRYIVGPEPESPEQVAKEYDLPVEAVLARISHRLSAATADTLADTALRSVGRLDVLFKYACGSLGRAPCLRGVSAVSRRQPVRNAG